MMILKFLLEKEFKLFFRHKFMPKLVIIFPLMIMLIMPWAATLDIKNIDTIVVDRDLSSVSREFVRVVDASSYFKLRDVKYLYDDAVDMLEFGRADLIVEIPAGFGHDYDCGTVPQLSVSINTVNTTKGVLGSAYIRDLTTMFCERFPPATPLRQDFAPDFDIAVKYSYNPLLDYKFTMIPSLMVIVMMLLCGFMPAVTIVEEKETGTIEQVNVTPVPKFQFILAKLIPYWIIGFLALTLSFLLAWAVYGQVPAGSIWTIYLFAGLFILTMTGMGVIISNHSATMQQATFVMLFFVMIFVMMCGILTPVASMPDWAQSIAALTPAKYMVDVMQKVYLRGSALSDMKTELIALGAMAAVLNVWAVLSYRKNG